MYRPRIGFRMAEVIRRCESPGPSSWQRIKKSSCWCGAAGVVRRLVWCAGRRSFCLPPRVSRTSRLPRNSGSCRPGPLLDAPRGRIISSPHDDECAGAENRTSQGNRRRGRGARKGGSSCCWRGRLLARKPLARRRWELRRRCSPTRKRRRRRSRGFPEKCSG